MHPTSVSGSRASVVGLLPQWPWCLALVLFVFPLGTETAASGPAAPVTLRADSTAGSAVLPIGEVRRVGKEGYVPDRLGDTVVVAGRVTTPIGVHPAENLLFIEDGSAGIAVHLRDDSEIRIGDSLRVRGTVRHMYGLTQIDAFAVTRVEGAREVPSPLPLTVSTADGEHFEGRLVRLRARIVRKGKNEGGRYLLLADPTEEPSSRIAAFIPNDRLSQFSLERFEPGMEISVTGPLGQYDYSAPYDKYYQVLPRNPEDLSTAGFLSAYYQTAIILIVGAALLAVIAVLTLRAAVKRRTEQLAESRARFRRLAEATFEGIIIHEDGEILDVNRALTEMTGYEREELVGREFLEVLSESTRDLIRDTVHPSPEEPYDAVMVRSDGSSFPAEIEEKVVEVPDRRVWVAAIRDVTDRKKWETEVLLAKEEAEEMARLKSSLLNNMSHELRTPITSIIGYAELIANEPNGDHQSFAARIRQSGKRLSRTLRSVLEMAQIESGTLDVEAHDVDVETLIQEVIEEHEPMLDDKGLPLTVETGPSTASLYTDRSLLYRVIGNLLHNAIKFTDEGSISITVDSADSLVRISISDTGIGIDPEFREDLFEPFKQESEGRARTYEGTGLGLALTQRMVDLLGGCIEVDSAKDEGSTFFVELPRVIPSDETAPKGVEAEAA